jgi:hypothetical protein
MSKVRAGRWTTAGSGDDGQAQDVVVFLIGMRINRLWQVWKWLPVFVAMPKMLAELSKNRSHGLLGTPRTMLSGRVIMVLQYWESFDALERYARASDLSHLPAWRAFNRRIRNDGSVGIFHETYSVHRHAFETVYANMPEFGLADALGGEPVDTKRSTASQRLDRPDDGAPVEPY